MAKEIISNIYLIEVPLPGNPLKALNSYLIKGPKRSLLVDTGFPFPACKEALMAGINQVGVDLQDLDFFVTHMHGDHSGLVYDMATSDSRVYCSEIDAELINDSLTQSHTEHVLEYFAMHGFPHLNLGDSQMIMKQYLPGTTIDFTFVQEGDVLSIGDYHFTCIMTPGHSPGHVCLYEAKHKILLGGDHILGDVSPNITGWPDRDNSLELYLGSLDKVKQMEIELLLPGHRSFIVNARQRIEELIKHHQKRLADVLSILENGTMNAYQVARKMDWDIAYASWDQFPLLQQWCATGEAVSHLEYLVHQNKVEVMSQEGRLLFALTN